jgi:hypothetical protein
MLCLTGYRYQVSQAPDPPGSLHGRPVNHGGSLSGGFWSSVRRSLGIPSIILLPPESNHLVLCRMPLDKQNDACPTQLDGWSST